MPAFHAPVPRVSVLVDTSGSMSEEALATVAAELQGVLAATGADVTVAAVDAALQGIKECRTIADAVALFKGGGGTVLIHGWNALLERKPTPDVIIVCTDGYIGGGGDGYPPTSRRRRSFGSSSRGGIRARVRTAMWSTSGRTT
jgi:predicted metal-dependent peptidase